MSRCLDHPRELVPGPDGALTCQACGSAWMTPAELEAMTQGALGALTVETREKSGAFAKKRHCPDCKMLLTPMRIGKMDGWVERCGTCDRYWVDPIDRRSFQLITKSAARQKAYESLAPAEKEELASGLAEAVSDSHEPQLSIGQTLLAALGIPMLERTERNRVPWMTWSLAAILVFAFLAGRALPDEFGPVELAWSTNADGAQVLWANFIHFDLLHLLGNVAFLLAFGDAMEQRLRRFWLLIAFIIFGPATVLIQGLFSPAGTLIGGASGAISVLVGASVILQPRARIIMVLFRTIPVRVPMLIFGIFEVGYQALMALMEVPGTAWYAHLSGLLIGIGLAFFGRQQVFSQVRDRL